MAILHDIYARYETTLENRLYRAMHELERLRTTGGSGGNQPHLLKNEPNGLGKKERIPLK